jgi:hypothetical protein
MRREYEYKIATMQSWITLLKRYHSGSGVLVRDMVDRERERDSWRGERFKAVEELSGLWGVSIQSLPQCTHTN